MNKQNAFTMTRPEGIPITARDIGERLGLSQSTVSRILANAPGHRVSAETRRRVVEAARELGYRPNAVAQSLRRRRTHIVGFYTGYGTLDSRNAFLAEVLGGLMRATDERQYDLLIHGVFRGGSTDDIYGELMDGRIDGLFLHTYANDPLAARLRASGLPVVAIADPVPGIPSVVCDDAGGTAALVTYLWEKGHRRIGFLRPTAQLTSVEIRFASFLETMRGLGASPHDAPVFEVNYEASLPALEKMRQSDRPPTALCCWNDLTAFDVIYHCKALGIRIPNQLAVVGFDGLFEARFVSRPLVTIGANWQTLTERAMGLLVRRMEKRGGADDETPLLTRLPVTLIPGDTA